MPRYDEMDQILGRIRARSEEQEAREPASGGEGAVSLQPADQDNTAAAMQELLRRAEQLRELLAPERVRALPQEQQDELHASLGKVLQELWQCEVALQRVAPYD